LSDLAVAADAVARGQLDQQVEPRGPDEMRRLGVGFNTMTENLQATLETMARQKSLADVGEFAAELAHEVRNALTAVHVDLQRARKRVDGGPAAPILEQTLEDVRHLDRVVTGALHVARSGRVQSTAVRLSDVLAASERAVANEASRAGVRMVRREPAGDLQVNGDGSALQLLFTNLMLNAVEASSPGGVVEVNARAEGDAVVLEVRDQGAGIPQEHLERVLEPLFSTKPAGTGLGLPIAQQIAKAHGGSLTLVTTPDTGVLARVKLPRASVPEGGAAN
jgi:two-component system sensor histidine kinase AtoS